MQTLRKKIEGTTTVNSIIYLLLLLVGVIVFNSIFGISGFLSPLLILLPTAIVLFLVFKFYLIFLSETDYSMKGMDIERRYLELERVHRVDPGVIVRSLKKEMSEGRAIYSTGEISAILNAEMQLSNQRIRTIMDDETRQENSKHLKSIIREAVILLALAWLVSQIFTLGVVQI